MPTSEEVSLHRRFTKESSENPDGEESRKKYNKIMCEIKTLNAGDNISFYHAVRCGRIGAVGTTTTQDSLIKKLKEISKGKIRPEIPIKNWGYSMYVSPQKDLAKGYMEPLEVDNKLQDDEYYLFEFKLKNDLNYIHCKNEKYEKGEVAGEDVPGKEDVEKLLRDNNKLGVDVVLKPFMLILGALEYAFYCKHDVNNMELIVPAQLIHYFKIVEIEKYRVFANGTDRPQDLKPIETFYL